METRRNRFTLIELLVIIAIIVVVAGILLPGLKSAREKASRINCAANLKQLGLACKMYATDFNEYFPATVTTIITTNAAGATNKQAARRDYNLLAVNKYLTAMKIYVCPSTANVVSRATTLLNITNLSYMYHGQALKEERVGPETVLCRDYGYGTTRSVNRGSVAMTPANESTKPNHVKFGNLVYGDGHVGAVAGDAWLTTSLISRTP